MAPILIHIGARIDIGISVIDDGGARRIDMVLVDHVMRCGRRRVPIHTPAVPAPAVPDRRRLDPAEPTVMVLECAAHQHADAERHQAGGDDVAFVVPADRAVAILPIDIDRRAVDHAGIVARYVHHVRLRWFDGDHLRGRRDAALIQNGRHHHMARHLHLLLRGTAQMAAGLSALAHDLHRVEHIVGVVGIGIAERTRPIQIAGQLGHHIRKGGQCLDTRIPRLRHRGLRAIGSTQIAIAA